MSMNALPMLSMGVGAITSGVGAYSQYQEGQAEQRAYNFNADVALANMKQEEADSEQKFAALMGRQRASYGKAGVDITSGSPLLVLADTAMQERREQQRIHEAGTSEAEIQRYYGRVASYKGKMGAMSSFLTGMGKTATDYWTYKKEGF
jgi:hypothetical protein